MGLAEEIGMFAEAVFVATICFLSFCAGYGVRELVSLRRRNAHGRRNYFH